ncbi:hypothetical protein ACFVT8_23810 [Lysinibacillus sp. NPDC058147]|uniref:hypothetical protein n=1 Tax=unclassified Lysinibacillus TaxID=2636778 RepID=UPI0036DC50C8
MEEESSLIEDIIPCEKPIECSNTEIIINAHTLLSGIPIAPEDRLRQFSDVEYEQCVKEWATTFLEEKYELVRRCGGSGDLGRDVICYTNIEEGKWVNYQCKHYASALVPSDIWVEIGKICYYSFEGRYSFPEAYYFVAPKGVNNTLHGLLIDNPDKLKDEFIENWDKNCRTKITSTKNIELDEGLKSFIEAKDFRIFNYLDPL